LRQRHQVLPSNVTASTLHATLVVPLAGPAESRLERVVRRERREAWPQDPRRPDVDLAHGGGQVVVGDRRDDPCEVGERRDVGRKKPGRILLRAEHREVATRVHQAHQEEPRLLAHARELHPDLEEIDLRDLARAVHERHGDLPLRASKLGHQAANGPLAGRVPGIAQQLPEPRRRQPLLARRERPARLPDRSRRLFDRFARWRGAGGQRRPIDRNPLGARVSTNRIARQSKLPSDLADRNALGVHLVSDHCNQIHGNHPGRVTLALRWPSTRF
jgi:hypothetical protein